MPLALGVLRILGLLDACVLGWLDKGGSDVGRWIEAVYKFLCLSDQQSIDGVGGICVDMSDALRQAPVTSTACMLQSSGSSLPRRSWTRRRPR